jgi:outer membrane protein insertion porin family
MNIKIISAIILVAIIAAPLPARKFSFKRQVVKKVEFAGNKYFSDGRLRSHILTKPNHWYNLFKKRRLSRSNLLYDKKQLERFYGQNGLLFARVEPEADYYTGDSSKAVVVFNIAEGKRVIVDEMRVSGGLTDLNRSIGGFARKIKPGKPVNHGAVLATLYKIRDLYADHGYPLASINYHYEFLNDSTRAIVHFAIAESSFVYNGDIEIVQEGEARTSESIFRRELLIKTSEPYNRKKMIESEQYLYSTGLIKFVNLKRTGEPHYNDNNSDTVVTDLKLIVTPRKSNFVNFRIGLNQEDYTPVLKTSVSWGNRNLWGTGRKLILSLSNSLQLGKRDTTTAKTISNLFKEVELHSVKNSIELNYIEPWFLGYRMPLSVTTIYEPQNENPILLKYYDRVSAEVALSRVLDVYTNLRFSTQVEFVDFHGVSDEDQEYYRLEGDNSIRRRFSIYGYRDTRDNIFVPQKGSYSYAQLDYVGHYLGGDFSYVKGEFSWSRYRILFGENMLASRFRIGMLEELGEKGKSSSDDRFTLGGAKTIRGFAENYLGPKWDESDGIDPESDLYGKPKGGRLQLLTNLELRRALFWRFGGTVFVDIGNIFFRFKDFRPNKIEATTGLGLQFFTPVGPVRLDYAFLVQKQLDLGEYALHFTLLYAF